MNIELNTLFQFFKILDLDLVTIESTINVKDEKRMIDIIEYKKDTGGKITYLRNMQVDYNIENDRVVKTLLSVKKAERELIKNLTTKVVTFDLIGELYSSIVEEIGIDVYGDLSEVSKYFKDSTIFITTELFSEKATNTQLTCIRVDQRKESVSVHSEHVRKMVYSDKEIPLLPETFRVDYDTEYVKFNIISHVTKDGNKIIAFSIPLSIRAYSYITAVSNVKVSEIVHLIEQKDINSLISDMDDAFKFDSEILNTYLKLSEIRYPDVIENPEDTVLSHMIESSRGNPTHGMELLNADTNETILSSYLYNEVTETYYLGFSVNSDADLERLAMVSNVLVRLYINDEIENGFEKVIPMDFAFFKPTWPEGGEEPKPVGPVDPEFGVNHPDEPDPDFSVDHPEEEASAEVIETKEEGIEPKDILACSGTCEECTTEDCIHPDYRDEYFAQA